MLLPILLLSVTAMLLLFPVSCLLRAKGKTDNGTDDATMPRASL